MDVMQLGTDLHKQITNIPGPKGPGAWKRQAGPRRQAVATRDDGQRQRTCLGV